MNKIDFVLAWVDGADKEWLAERRKYNPAKGADNSAARYRDWENLQYWFRGVEKFAPFAGLYLSSLSRCWLRSRIDTGMPASRIS